MEHNQKTKELIKQLYDAVIDMDEYKVKELSKIALGEGIDANYAVTHGLSAAMDKVGELYAQNEYFVPQLLLCADALYAGLEVLSPHIKVSETEKKRQIIIGTVEGDIHDIGKNLVKIMFEAAGWLVHDLGKDVEIKRFAIEQSRTKSDIVALSAMLTTSMLAMAKAIELIRAEDDSAVIMVGGAPLTWDIAKSYGANGFADNAGEAVKEATALLKRLGK